MGFVILVVFAVAVLANRYGSWVWIGAIAIPLLAIARQQAGPCHHGVRGAKRKTQLCSLCVAAAEELRHGLARQAQIERQNAYDKWRRQARMPEFILGMHPRDFEAFVCSLFSQMGYDVEMTPYTGDGGIDGYLRRDGALALLQCKRVKGSVGEPVLRDLFGTMNAKHADSGVVVTTGSVSRQARAWAADKPIRIIELGELVDLFRDHFDEAEVVPPGFQPSPRPRGAVRRRRGGRF